MKKMQPENARTAGIVIMAVSLFFVVLFACFLALRQTQRHAVVTMPPVSASASAPEQPTETQPFVVVQKENIRDAVATLSRPEYYHETLSITRYWEDGQATERVDRWVSAGVTALTVRSDADERHYLSDGTAVYLWHGDGTDGVSRLSTAAATLDDLAGVPSYEAVLHSDAALTNAEYVELADQAMCLYIEYAPDDDGYFDQLWVNVNTGLLYRAHACRTETDRPNALIYQAEQTALEVFAAKDTALASVFRLPDGSAPFDATGTETPAP